MTDAALLPLTRKLDQLRPLGEPERSAIRKLHARIEVASSRTLLVREGTTPFECCILLAG